jgi:hypothetical protein
VFMTIACISYYTVRAERSFTTLQQVVHMVTTRLKSVDASSIQSRGYDGHAMPYKPFSPSYF